MIDSLQCWSRRVSLSLWMPLVKSGNGRNGSMIPRTVLGSSVGFARKRMDCAVLWLSIVASRFSGDFAFAKLGTWGACIWWTFYKVHTIFFDLPLFQFFVHYFVQSQLLDISFLTFELDYAHFSWVHAPHFFNPVFSSPSDWGFRRAWQFINCRWFTPPYRSLPG